MTGFPRDDVLFIDFEALTLTARRAGTYPISAGRRGSRVRESSPDAP
jgi:hypothetical protein